MDKLDSLILKSLMDDGRISWKTLAAATKVSAPTIAERVQSLQKKKIITGFCATLNPESVGCHLTAYVAVTLGHPDARALFIKKIGKIQMILECHHIAGDYDYLLKIRCRNTKALDALLNTEIKDIKGVLRTQTTIVMDTIKETSALYLSDDVFDTTNAV